MKILRYYQYLLFRVVFLVTRPEEAILKHPDYLDKEVGIKDLQI